jgi:hypothetical protein
MKKTILIMSCKDGWESCETQTKASVLALRKAGVAHMIESGSSDVAFARSRALSLVCEELRGQLSDRDVVLMADDDMDFDVETAQQVVDQCRELGKPTSAAYATITSKLAATRMPNGLWCCGLGLFAIPAAMLLELERESDSFELYGKAYTEFTWSCASDGQWVNEDYRLCQRLGGAVLLPVAVGHVKKCVILPDEETLELIRRGEALS